MSGVAFHMTLTVKYLKHLQLEGKAENTIDTYKYHLIEFLVWISEQNLTIFDASFIAQAIPGELERKAASGF